MILFFDTETTGLPKNWKAPVSDVKNWPRMIQLAYLLYDLNGNFIESKNYIIKPDNFIIPQEASSIHGITTERAGLEGIELIKVLTNFQVVIEKATIMIAHNMEFDEKIIGCEFYRITGKDPLRTKQKFCTMKSDSIISFCAIPPFQYGKYKWPKLSELYYKLFKSQFVEHNAATDTEATAKCYWELKKRGIIKNMVQNSSAKKELLPLSIESESTKAMKLSLDEYCRVHNYIEVPVAAKAEAIMFLEFKFKQIEKNQSSDEEIKILQKFHSNSDEIPIGNLNLF